MNISVVAVLLLILAAVIGVLVVLLAISGNSSLPFTEQGAVSENLRAMVRAQRDSSRPGQVSKTRAGELALAAAAESDVSRKKRVSSGTMTNDKKLRYARIPISGVHFNVIRGMSSVLTMVFAILEAPEALRIQSALLGLLLPWIFFTSLLTYLVNRRVNQFDADYPVMLMSYVSLLKTGLNTITGLESAGKGLDEGTLVRSEIELLIERLKLGLTEEQAINSFGEDVAHPELELFVQSLLLSRKVGGTLSTTLERLAKQVRKRQQFRKQAIAAVGMERASIVAVAGVMTCLLGFIFVKSPELIVGAFTDDTGLKTVGWAVVIITMGFLWSRAVTNIKI